MALHVNCVEKLRDKRGNIIGYKLQDLKGHSTTVSATELKLAIRRKQVVVDNLIMTANGRLIDRKDTTNEEIKEVIKTMANTIFENLGYRTDMSFNDNSEFDCVSLTFDQDIRYKGEYYNLEIAYYKEPNNIYLCLMKDGDQALEEAAKYSKTDINRAVRKFISIIPFRNYVPR